MKLMKMSHIIFYLLFYQFFILFDVSSFESGHNLLNNSTVEKKVNSSAVFFETSDGITNETSETNFLKLFDVWNPQKFIYFWKNREKEDVLISTKCSNDIDHYLAGISAGYIWAVKMNDASGRPTAGIFSGNRFWVGAPDQCRTMENEFLSQHFIESEMKDADILPFRVSPSSTSLELQLLKPAFNDTHKITLGLCLPSNCNPADIVKLLNFYIKNSGNHSERRIFIDHVRNLSEGYSLWKDTTFHIILVCFALAISLAIFGTLYDVALRYQYLSTEKSVNNLSSGVVNGKPLASDGDHGKITLSKLWSVKQHNRSLDVWHAKDVPKPMSEALLSFSLLTNISKVASLDVGHDTLAPIHGLRVISMLWIILVHTCLIANAVADTNMFKAKAQQDFLYQTISNGSYAVDTFFFISGCLVAFLYFRTMLKRRLEDMEITKGIIGKFMQFLGMMCYRYLRLTPPYLLTLGLIQISMKWYHAHAMIELPSTDHTMCEKYWWRNALYINTYFPMNERCIPWAWYLANDTQFYTIGIIVLIISTSFISIGAAIGAFFLIASWITTAVITLYNHHIPTIEDPFAHYDSLYDKPWSRIGPYLIGMATGWYLYKIDCKLKLNKVIAIAGWAVSITTLLSIVYGLYWETFGPFSSALYTALSHSGWAIGVGWVLIVCATENGGLVNKILSWKYIYPLSRLTYCAYLIHPALTRALILRGENSLHLTQEFIAILFFGITVASYVASLFVSLLFEAPMVSLLRIVHPHRQWKFK